jgi:hypothetical protein
MMGSQRLGPHRSRALQPCAGGLSRASQSLGRGHG